MRTQSVLVTGGLGFVGRHLVESLVSLGKEVTVFDNVRTAIDDSPPPGATLRTGDLRNSAEIGKAVGGIDLVFHLAANANGTLSVTTPRLDFEINTVGTFSLAETLLDSNVRRFAYVSSASVYGRPLHFPMAEDHATRPFVPYGASKLNNQPIQIIGDIDRKTRDFVHVSDLVAGLLTIADQAEIGEVFNIGSGQETSMRQLVTAIHAATGREPELRIISEVENDTYRLVADISKIERRGYRPGKSLHDGVRELAESLGPDPELPGTSTIFTRGQHGESS